MATQAKLGYGTKFQMYKLGVWDTVAEISNIDGPDIESDDVEVTNMDSPDSYKEYIPGLKESGEIKITANFIGSNATHQQLVKDQKNRTVRNWRVLLPDADADADKTTWSFLGYVKSMSFKTPTDSQMTIDASIKVAGAPTLASENSPALTALAAAGGSALTLSPTFSATTYLYTATVASGDTSVTVTPTGTAEALYVNEVEVSTGEPSGAIALSTGVNAIVVKSQSEDKTPLLYTILVTKS